MVRLILMQGFFIISCEIPVFPADNVCTSAGKRTAWTAPEVKVVRPIAIFLWCFLCGENFYLQSGV